MDTDVAIIGAGHNALVAATYLARAGLNVHLFESRPRAGGAMQTEELWPGFKFSTCAHLLHAFSPKIMRDLGLMDRGIKIDPRADVILLRRDGTYDTTIELDHPNHRTAGVRLTAQEKDGLTRYNAFKQCLFDLVAPFRLGPPPSLDQLRRQAAGTPAAEALELALSRRLWDVQDHFLPTERLRERHAGEFSAVACNPLAFVLVYNAITQPESGTGERPRHGFVRGGMGNLARAITEAAVEAGVHLHLASPVQNLLVSGGRTTGIRLADDREISARVVLSCADTKTTFSKLVPPNAVDADLRSRLEARNSHVSCLKLLAGVSELPKWTGWDGDPDLPHRGSVQLEMSREGVRSAYADLDAGRSPERLLLSFNVPSMQDPALAPEGAHTASLYIYPAPARLASGTWEDQRKAVTEHLIDQITEYAPNFRRSILHCKLRTPLDLEREVGLTDGCIWHLQHTPDQLLANRPLPELADYRTPIGGFYLGGSGQHPGGEVTGMPGHNAAHEILKDLGVEVGRNTDVV